MCFLGYCGIISISRIRADTSPIVAAYQEVVEAVNVDENIAWWNDSFGLNACCWMQTSVVLVMNDRIKWTSLRGQSVQKCNDGDPILLSFSVSRSQCCKPGLLLFSHPQTMRDCATIASDSHNFNKQTYYVTWTMLVELRYVDIYYNRIAFSF